MQSCARSINIILLPRLPLVIVIVIALHCPLQVQGTSSACRNGVVLRHLREECLEPDSPYSSHFMTLAKERVALIQTVAARSENQVVESSVDSLGTLASPPRYGRDRTDAGGRPRVNRFGTGSEHRGCFHVNRVCHGRPLGVLDVTTNTVLLSVFSGGVGVGVAGTLLVLLIMRASGSSESKSADQSTPMTGGLGPEEAAPLPPQSSAFTGIAAQGSNQPLSSALSELHSATEDLESMHLFWPRASCLVGLLLVQSLSSLIMTGFNRLFVANPVLVFFLTMIVGTGGNVGGQTVVMAVRKLALGEDVGVGYEAFVGLKLCAVLVPVAFIRCWAQQVSVSGSMTVAISVLLVVVVGALLGAGLPKMFFWLSIDPAHATPTIQVVMDILGVCIICFTGLLLLDEHGTGEKWAGV